MRWGQLATTTLLGLSVWVSSQPAEAQQAGYAANHFAPSERGSQWFALDSLDIRGNGRLALGVVTDYSYRSLVDYRSNGTVDASIVRNQLITHLGGAVTLGDRVRVGVTVPLQLFSDGNPASIRGVTHAASSEAAVGDLRMSADVRLFGAHSDAATMAFGGELYVPSGSTSAYTGDGEPRFLPRLLFAGRSSDFAYAAKLGVLLRGRDEDFGDGRIGSAVVFGVSGGVLLANGRVLLGPELLASTVVSKGHAFEARTTPVEALLGGHFDLGGDVRVGAGFGFQLTRGYGVPVTRGLLSLEWVPGDAKPTVEAPTDDRDGDGVPDADDACGFVAGVKSDKKDQNGCPPDADGDGIPDNLDACPTVVGAGSPDARTNGCPADTDGDGVPDSADACPHLPGKRSADERTTGCPDQDGDDIVDTEDACPTKPGPRTSDKATNGCPVTDRDKDGVLDTEDACPDEPGKPDPDPKKNGCPKAFLKDGTIHIGEQVKFKTASAELAGKESDAVLEAVLAVLKAHPDVKRVRVEGHTDNTGDAARNKTLSQSRAETVVKWLTDHGIDKSRLSASGLGIEKPIDSNETEAGRTNNRRVEFHVEKGSER